MPGTNSLSLHAGLPTVDWLTSHGIRIGVILGLAVGITMAASAAVRRLRRRIDGTPNGTAELSMRRSATLTQTLSSAVRAVIWTLALLLVLGELGMDLGPLIAGAGIVGVALGFGAQALVRDFLSGFFILSEDQFGVGEVVEITAPGKQVTGKVEAMSLRITTVRSFDGTQHVVPNGNIQVVGNRSRGWARAIVDVQLAWRQDLDEARDVLEELFEGFPGHADPERSWIVDGPRVLGVEDIADGSVALRVVADTRPTRRAEVERALRAAIKARFAERGIVTAGTPEADLVEADAARG